MWDAILNDRGRPDGQHGPATTSALIELAAHRRRASEDALGPAEPCLPPKVVARIGERLRDYYADMLDEPVPERFAQLIGRIGAPSSGDEER